MSLQNHWVCLMIAASVYGCDDQSIGENGTGVDVAQDDPSQNLAIGVCEDNIYRFENPYDRTLGALDCAALGLSCRAEVQTREIPNSGCIQTSCDGSLREGCDGSIVRRCEDGELIVRDCEQESGPGSFCSVHELDHPDEWDPAEDYVFCTESVSCTEPSTAKCVDTQLHLCQETSELDITDCRIYGDDVSCGEPTSGNAGALRVCCLDDSGHCISPARPAIKERSRRSAKSESTQRLTHRGPECRCSALNRDAQALRTAR